MVTGGWVRPGVQAGTSAPCALRMSGCVGVHVHARPATYLHAAAHVCGCVWGGGGACPYPAQPRGRTRTPKRFQAGSLHAGPLRSALPACVGSPPPSTAACTFRCLHVQWQSDAPTAGMKQHAIGATRGPCVGPASSPTPCASTHILHPPCLPCACLPPPPPPCAGALPDPGPGAGDSGPQAPGRGGRGGGSSRAAYTGLQL